MIFIKTLQKIFKQDLTLQILKQADRFVKEKNKKVSGLMNDKLGEQIWKEFVGIRAKHVAI